MRCHCMLRELRQRTRRPLVVSVRTSGKTSIRRQSKVLQRAGYGDLPDGGPARKKGSERWNSEKEAAVVRLTHACSMSAGRATGERRPSHKESSHVSPSRVDRHITRRQSIARTQNIIFFLHDTPPRVPWLNSDFALCWNRTGSKTNKKKTKTKKKHTHAQTSKRTFFRKIFTVGQEENSEHLVQHHMLS